MSRRIWLTENSEKRRKQTGQRRSIAASNAAIEKNKNASLEQTATRSLQLVLITKNQYHHLESSLNRGQETLKKRRTVKPSGWVATVVVREKRLRRGNGTIRCVGWRTKLQIRLGIGRHSVEQAHRSHISPKDGVLLHPVSLGPLVLVPSHSLPFTTIAPTRPITPIRPTTPTQLITPIQLTTPTQLDAML